MKIEHPFIGELQTLSKNVEEIKSILLTNERVKPFYSDDEFCEIMGISKSTAKAWRKQGIIVYSLIGNKLYYKIDSIHMLLENHCIDKKKE